LAKLLFGQAELLSERGAFGTGVLAFRTKLLYVLFEAVPSGLFVDPTDSFCQLFAHYHPPFKNTAFSGRDTFARKPLAAVSSDVVVLAMKAHLA
jgi:hypothetical protein